MAEIRVEERRGGSTTWVWILLLLLLVAAGIWYVLGRSDERSDVTAPAGAAVPAAPASTDSASLPGHPPASTMIVVRA